MREWLITENVIPRTGLIVAATYAFYVGVVAWGSGVDALHPGVVALELLIYLAAFAMLFSAASGVALCAMRHLIPVFFIFALLVQAFLYISRQPEPVYGTDGAAYTHLAADLVLRGQNPYGQDLSASLQRFRMPPTLRTGTVDGNYEVTLPYPALSFLIYIPFLAAGVGDVRIILLVFHVLLLILVVVAAPRWVKPLVLIPFFISPETIAYTLGTVNDLPWVFFITAAAFLWRRRDASALLYGLAISLKQHAWVLLPFIIVKLWLESRDLTPAARMNMIARYFGIAEIVFLAINGPFILLSPQAWIQGVLAPPLGALVMDGEGLSILSQVGLLYAPRLFYTISALLVGAALVVVYWAYFKRLSNLLWLFPAVILWFPYRSLQSYFIYWIPPLLVSLYTSFRTLPASLDVPETEREHLGYQRRRVAALGMSAVAVAFIGGGILFYALFGKPALAVDVERALMDPKTSLVNQLDVTVTNDSKGVVHPVFWVKETGHPRFHWDIIRGPRILAAGEQAHYTIAAAYPEFQVPDGNTFSVAVNDDRDANTASYSRALAVQLNAHASLTNSDFFYWSEGSSNKQEQPYAWGFYQVGNDKTASAQLTAAQVDGRHCVAITASRTAALDYATWLGGFLDQWIEFPDYKFRVPVYPTFAYQGGDAPQTVLGVEVKDDAHTLWYIFSDSPERLWTDPVDKSKAYHLIPAPLNRWSETVIDPSRDYGELGWSLPAPQAITQDGQAAMKRMVNFRVFVASQEEEPFRYGGCFGAIVQHLR